MLRSFNYSKRFFSNSSVLRNTLAFVETNGSSITPASLSLLTAARQLQKPITVVLAGSNSTSSEITGQLAKIASIDKILVAKDPKFNTYLPEELSPLFTKILTENPEYTHFFVAASSVGKNVLPRVGAVLDVQPISDIIKIESENTFVRPIYAGNALATVKSNDKLILSSVRSSSFAPVEFDGSNSAAIEEVSIEDSGNRTEFVGEEIIKSERPDLGSAIKVVSGGRALKSKEQFAEIIEPLANSIGAAIGASRAAVDSGFCDNSLQVGQTGKVVAPELYIAVGISGAIQHLAGMKDSKTIVAINKDEEAPIFNVADIGLVGDLFDVVPELTEKLKNV